MSATTERKLSAPLAHYDLFTMPKAKIVLDYLKLQPDFRWINLIISRPKTISQALKDRVDENGKSLIMDWSSFWLRNPDHEIARGISDEFLRVFGRHLTLRDFKHFW